jgi:hypothetical protein
MPLLLCVFVACASTTGSQIFPFTITVVEQGVKEDADYEVKYRIYFDGEFDGETSAAPRSRKHSYTSRISKGRHLLRIEFWTKADGEWQKADESVFSQQYAHRWMKVNVRKSTELKLTITRNGRAIEKKFDYP